MKALVNLKSLALILLVLFTIALPSRQSSTKFKAPLTLTELSLSDYEFESKLITTLFNENIFTILIPELSDSEQPILPTTFVASTITNSSLNFLYLTHSPPSLT